MTIQTRPDGLIFADGAKAGEVANFPDIARGWGLTFDQTEGIPPMEWMNGIMHRQDRAIKYLLQQGISEWSTDEDYPTGGIVRHGVGCWQAIQDNKGSEPQNDSVYWTKFADTSNAILNYPTVPTSKQGDLIYVDPFGLMKWDMGVNNYLAVIQTSLPKGIPLAWVSDTQITVNAGAVRDSTNKYDIVLPAPVLAALASPENNTWYHVFVCINGVDQKVVFDININPTLPAGYPIFKRLGSVKTDDTGKILKFFQFGKKFVWDTPAQDIHHTSLYAITYGADVPTAVSVPPGVNCKISAQVMSWGQNNYFNFRSSDQVKQVLPAVDWKIGLGMTGSTGNQRTVLSYEMSCCTNKASQVSYDFIASSDAAGNCILQVATLSYEEI